jgi:hypothetical protein
LGKINSKKDLRFLQIMVKHHQKQRFFGQKKCGEFHNWPHSKKKLHEKHYQNKKNGHGKTTAINQKQ